MTFKGGNWRGKRRGEANPHSKLTEYTVDLIRERYATGKYTQKQLAAEFGISQGHISDIVTRRLWK
jgi:hypothetical protein